MAVDNTSDPIADLIETLTRAKDIASMIDADLANSVQTALDAANDQDG
jgi:hypothetical protein